jgi:hypothetical protein
MVGVDRSLILREDVENFGYTQKMRLPIEDIYLPSKKPL